MVDMDYRIAKGWLSLAERDALVHYASKVAKDFPSSCIVNIGVEYGASLHCLRAGHDQGVIYGVDLDISKLQGNPKAILIEGNSNEPSIANNVPNDLGLVFIDGGHDYATVLGDLRLWSPKVADSGWLLLHDYSSWELHKGVVDAVATWERRIKKWRFVEQVDTIRVYQRAQGVL